jgi:hypothetical protein
MSKKTFSNSTIQNLKKDSTFKPTFLDVEYLVVGGGGASGANDTTSRVSGGGGAGGYRSGTFKLNTNTPYRILVGLGGNGLNGSSGYGEEIAYTRSGKSSMFSSIIAIGGGGGGNGGAGMGAPGGSSGGNGRNRYEPNLLQPPIGDQGNIGGLGGTATTAGASGGGGGAGGPGEAGQATRGGNGGIGIQSSITGTATYYAGGGGGARQIATGGGAGSNGSGGLGGGGNGQIEGGNKIPGTPNTGGGGGGVNQSPISPDVFIAGADGGSGIIILKISSKYYCEFSSGTQFSTITSVPNFNIYSITQTSTEYETVTFY